MKTVGFLLLTIGWIVLMDGIDRAATYEPLDQSGSPSAAVAERNSPGTDSQVSSADRAKGETGDGHRDSPQIRRKHYGRSHVNSTKRATHATINRMCSAPPAAINLLPLGSNRAGDTEAKSPIQNGTVKRELRQYKVPLNNLRHPSSNPAIIGGLMNSKARKTEAINGSDVDHRR